MKKLLAFVAILGMVAISTNTQATTGCWGGGGSGTCVMNTSASGPSYEGTTYFANPYSPVNATMHVVSFSTSPQGGGIGTVTTENGYCQLYFQGNFNEGAYRVEAWPINNPCPEMYTTEVGWIDITEQAINNAGYVYINATW